MPKVCKRAEKAIKQQNFLRKINDRKDVLFGPFSSTVTKETKRGAWIEIRDYAVSIGLISAEKDYTYVRDATWPNIRNRTMVKIDKSKKTGEGGGSESKLDDTDQLVIEIIGKDSPIIEGIGVLDSMEESDLNKPILSPIIPEDDELAQLISAEPKYSGTVNNSGDQKTLKGQRKKKVVIRGPNESKVIDNFKIKKLQLEVRKLELEVWEKENLLGVEHSDLTHHIQTTKCSETVNTEYIVNSDGDILMIKEKNST